MAALDFPASPTNGQVFTSNGSSWTYDSTKVAWRSSPYEPGAAITSATAPTTPQNGDIWFNTNDGTLYTYYNDGTTAQWVEVRSEIATSQVGLVPIAPTSVQVGSGTATVSTNGTVTASAVSSLSLNGVFTSAYKNYRLVATDLTSAAGYVSLVMQMRNAGANNSASSYYQYWTMKRLSGAFQDNTGGPSTSYTLVGFDNNTTYSWSFQGEINAPFATRNTTVSGQGFGADATSTYMLNSTVLHAVNSSFDGITFSPSSSTMSGTFKIYGYN